MDHESIRFRGLFDLTGRTAVVTGACGILGTAFSEALAAHGAAVAMLDLAATEPAARADACTQGCHGFECDVRDESQVALTLDAVEGNLGQVDILVNNAATKGANPREFFTTAPSMSLETWREVMDVNLNGAFLMAREVGRRMVARSAGGSIIQIASVYGVIAPDGRLYEGSEYLGAQISTPPVYSASKAGLIGLTRYLAAEYGEHGIRVNTVSPGGVESGQNEIFVERYRTRVPLRRMATTQDIAGAVVFLAGAGAQYLTGQNIVVDGGMSIW